ncbi:MAG: phosphoribosylamine--glycine ligase, partial [Candidatus Omnitrophica bacterium]|nr:phosphoribosylamine--glycine ligase [Candidatus Omnitrophota bacterium]
VMPALEWYEKSCLTVVLASEGYPGHYKKNSMISGLEALPASDSAFVFHAGTARDSSGKWITDGGRILAVSALGDNLKQAYDLAYQTLDKIRAVGSFYRRDIGKRALEVLR